jgi:hypothetical protein
MKATATRAPRALKPEDVIAAEAATAERKAAREANSASLTKAVQDVISEYYSADKAVTAAQATLATKLESAYVALAKLAHDNEMSPEMSKEVLTVAIEHFYGAGSTKLGLGTATKLRSQLLRAMHPEVRGKLPAILKTWDDAWTAETKAKASDPKAETPLRDKFDNRDGAITQALKLAQGKDANAKGVGGVNSVILTKPADVLTWVKEHPRQARGATAPTPKPVIAPTVTGTAREQAAARVTGLINAVQDVAKDYPAATALFADVLAALRKCTGDLLVPTAAPKATPAEMVPGAAQLDDAISEEEIAIELIRMRRERAAAAK